MEENSSISGTYPNKENAIFVENLNVSYGKIPILKNVSMHVEEGTVYGLIGSSGCGKTTLLHSILNLIAWNSGEIFVFGNKVDKTKGIETRNIGYMPQDLALFDQLTVGEIMRYFSQLYGMTEHELGSAMLFLEDLMDLPGYGSRKICTLSGGQKRRISLSLTLIHQPRLLILDEPTVGLDPLRQESLWNYLFNLCKTSKTSIVITTHYIEEVKCANKVGIMQKGRLLVEEDPASLMRAHQTEILEVVVRSICYHHAHNPEKKYTNSSHADKIEIHPEKNVSRTCRKETMQNHISYPTPPEARLNPGISEQMFFNSWFSSLMRALAYSKIVLINFMRHPMFLFIFLFIPPFQLLTTGAVFGVEPKLTPIGVVNYEALNWQNECSLISGNENTSSMNDCDLSRLSCHYLKLLHKDDLLNLIEFENVEDAHQAVEKGDIKGFIKIQNNYTMYIIERAATLRFAPENVIKGSTILMDFDMTDFVQIFYAENQIFIALDSFIKELTNVCNFDLRLFHLPFYYRYPVYGKMEGTGQEYIFPGVIIGLLFEVPLCVIPLTFIREFKDGTLVRSKMAGLRFAELMAGLYFSVVVMSFFQSLFCFITMKYIINLEVHGNPFIFFGVCIIAAVSGGTYGLLVGTLFKDEFLVIISVIVYVIAFATYVGLLRPEEVISASYRPYVYYCFPSAAIVKSFRWVVNRGVGLMHFQVWSGILITLGWITVCSLCSFVTLKFSNP